jgi:hypothetical protein
MFQVSPGVNISEIDLATGVPAVSSTEAAIAGVFRWGPVGQRFLVTSEPELAAKTGKPSNLNAETWFVASSFLSYADALHVVRVSGGTSAMAVFPGSVAPAANTQTVNNSDAYAGVTFSANVAYVARYPGDLGNSLRVSVCDSVNAYSKPLSLVANADIAVSSNFSVNVGSSVATVSIGFAGSGTQLTANTQAFNIRGALQVGDNIRVGNSTVGLQYLKIASIGAVTSNSTIASFTLNFATPYRLYTNWQTDTLSRFWEFYNLVDGAPGVSSYNSAFGNTAAVDEVHAVVVDDAGKFTGAPGTILETFFGMSRLTDSKTADNATNYFRDVLNTKSAYVWVATERTGAGAANSATVTMPTTDAPLSIRMVGGTDGDGEDAIALAKLAQGYDVFKNADDVDVSLVMTGKARNTDGATLANYIIDNITEVRKDCVSFISPPKEAVVNNVGREVESVIGFAAQIRDSSYAFMDSGYKYMYDKYNDVYRWIPLNGDVAGLCVRTDQTNDSWWSPAGQNRGQIKNAVKLAYNPNKAQRDVLYRNSVNPVIVQPGAGTILFGDKTMLSKASPFSRINVRRLFITLEKAIASYSKTLLFEFNDDFTRAQFRSKIVPYLRDIQGRRGVTDFLVVCDATNNTSEVIDSQSFVGDIYIKPNRAINSIQLNFVAVRSGVQFSEIVGQF